MNGTEKQIKWAMDIQKAMLLSLENAKSRLIAKISADYDVDEKDVISVVETAYTIAIEKIKSEVNASWFIDNRNRNISYYELECKVYESIADWNRKIELFADDANIWG